MTNMSATKMILIEIGLLFVILSETQSVPLKDSFDSSCFSGLNSTETASDSDDVELIQGDTKRCDILIISDIC